jgi:hypothetical protein
MSDDWKKCRRCKHRKSPAEFKLAKGNRMTSACAGCLDVKATRRASAKAAKATKAEAWTDPTAPPAKSKPGPKPDALLTEERARAGREREIRLLIRRYEAARETPGPDRAAAYNALGRALSRHGRPVSDGVREWSWARGMGEVTSRLIRREWRRPEDPHANPRRVARGDMVTMGTDLLEMP